MSHTCVALRSGTNERGFVLVNCKCVIYCHSTRMIFPDIICRIILWKIMENNLTCSYIFSLEFYIIYIFVYVSHLYFFINQEKRYYSLFLENIFLWYVWYIRYEFVNELIYVLICLHRKLESCIYECIFLLLEILNLAISNF